MMRFALVAAVAMSPFLAAASPGGGPSFGTFVRDFGPSLVADCPNPEGIAVDRNGLVYASSFAFQPVANICVLDSAGKLLRKIPVAAGATGSAALLGMLDVPGEGLYVTDFANGTPGNGRLLRVDRHGHVGAVAGGFTAPNAIARDRHGNLFVSDSFAGTITRLRKDGTHRITWAQGAPLTTTGQPPFGANGLAFDAEERYLYVANTGDSTVLRYPVKADGSAGPIEVFAKGSALDAATGTAQSLHGADGIMFDAAGYLWVCANQANELQVLSPEGEVVARYRGAAGAALDFPASIVFRGQTLYVTNLSLATGGVNSKLSVIVAPYPGLPLWP